MARITKAMMQEAERRLRQEIEYAAVRNAIEEEYYATVSGCGLSECMHYDMDIGGCSLKICAYDLKDDNDLDDFDLDDDDYGLESVGFEWVE